MATPRLSPSLQIDPALFQRLAGRDGRLSAKEIGTSGLPPPPKGYQYTYDFKNQAQPLQLKKDSSLGKTLGKAGLIAGGIAATAATGGAASPLLAAAIGAGTGAGVGAIDNGWKGALIGGGTGALTGGLMGGAGGAASGAVKQGAAQGLKTAAANPQNYASIAGQVVPGTAGSLLSLAGGAGGGNVASSGASGVLSSLLKDPKTYQSLLSLIGNRVAPAVGASASGAAAGMAGERGEENRYNINRNNAQTSRYGIQQGAMNDVAGMQERATLDRANLGIAAPNARAGQVVRGSLMELLQPAKISHPRATIPQMSGGLTPAALSGLVRSSGRDLQTQGAEAIRTKSDVPAMPDFKSNLLTPPEVDEYKGPGTTETALGTGGMIADILAALAKQGQGQPKATPPIAADPTQLSPPQGTLARQPFPGWAPEEPIGTDTTGWRGWGR